MHPGDLLQVRTKKSALKRNRLLIRVQSLSPSWLVKKSTGVKNRFFDFRTCKLKKFLYLHHLRLFSSKLGRPVRILIGYISAQ